MPRRDGTGPTGQGNFGGRMGGPVSGGPGGCCKCPNCGTVIQHGRGEPCSNIKCPKCGTPMVRG